MFKPGDKVKILNSKRYDVDLPDKADGIVSSLVQEMDNSFVVRTGKGFAQVKTKDLRHKQFYDFLKNINISAEYEFTDRTILITENDASKLITYLGTLSLEDILSTIQIFNNTNFDEFKKLCQKAKIKRYMSENIQF